MSEMIKCVARAIAFADRGVDAEFDYERDGYRSMAVAAIEAMRAPTPAMNEAGRLSGEWMLDSEGDKMDGNANDVWRAMIDAALKN